METKIQIALIMLWYGTKKQQKEALEFLINLYIGVAVTK